MVARHGAGYDTVDLESAKRHGVVVLNAPIANSMSVAELTIFYMLHCSRNFKLVEEKCLKIITGQNCAPRKLNLMVKPGLIGVGNIGSRVALKALHGFNMKVIAYDPYKTQQQIPEGVELTDDFDRIFKESDFVSLHCPTTAETTDFVGEKQFSMMKPSAYFINTARGKLVDERALYHALSQQIIAGAGVDVLKKEPFDANDPIFALSNIVIGPISVPPLSKQPTGRLFIPPSALTKCYRVKPSPPVLCFKEQEMTIGNRIFLKRPVGNIALLKNMSTCRRQILLTP